MRSNWLSGRIALKQAHPSSTIQHSTIPADKKGVPPPSSASHLLDPSFNAPSQAGSTKTLDSLIEDNRGRSHDTIKHAKVQNVMTGEDADRSAARSIPSLARRIIILYIAFLLHDLKSQDHTSGHPPSFYNP